MGEELVRNFSGKRAYVQGSFCGSRTLRISVYTLQERIGEIRSAAMSKKIALAVLGGVAAAGAGYTASHQTTTYSGYATNG